ncbi:MAG: HEAT repeat domain-containing protein, partial [Planctomycetota bacterium]|nr:HEAT repeat domain-containing protein [Planctomycetota bacterium]
MRTALIALAASVLLSGLAFGAPVGEPPPDFSGLTVLELLGKLRDADEMVCSDAARELAKRCSEDEGVVDRVAAMLREPAAATRRYAVLALVGSGSPKAVPYVAAMLKDRDAVVRESIGHIIRDFRSKAPGYFAPLIAALKDPEARVRSSAAEALGVQGDARAIDPLIAATKDTDFAVRYYAMQSLGELGGEKAKAAAAAGLAAPDERVRFSAARVLAGMRDPRAVPILIDLLGSKESMVAPEAARMLGELGDRRAADALASAAAKSDDPHLRDAAAWALGRLGAPGGSGSEVDPKVRQKLDQPISFEFQGIALEEALRFCADYSGASIQARWDALQAAGVERSAKVTLNLKSVPLGGALRLIL